MSMTQTEDSDKQLISNVPSIETPSNVVKPQKVCVYANGLSLLHTLTPICSHVQICPPRRLVGVANLGNTCFANAQFQCLASIAASLEWSQSVTGMNDKGGSPSLVDYVYKTCERGNRPNNALLDPLSQHLATLFMGFRALPNNSMLSSRAVFLSLIEAAPQFGDQEQHDSSVGI